MAYPPVIIVDENDRPIGLSKLKDAWAQGLYFRVIAIAVKDENGRILLQKRSANMEIDPGRWDISVGGHVDEGQTYKIAARRELEEELGIVGVEPQEFGKQFMDSFFLMLYQLTVSSNTRLELETAEVADARWFTPEAFESLLRDHPEQCAEFLLDIYDRAPALFGVKAPARRA